MPRCRRQKSMSGIYHVMVRGVGRVNIFHDDEDRNRFLETLARFKEANNFELYAYCLIPNHVHLLMKEMEETISRLMKRLGVSYVYYFNQKYNRVGHLFQDRYKSEVIDSERYFLACSRYIHNNPVAAEIVRLPEQYVWSSYGLYLKPESNDFLVNTDLLLNCFSNSRKEAIMKLKQFTDNNNNDCFMDCDHIQQEVKTVVNRQDLLTKILKKQNTTIAELRTTKNTVKRNAVLKELKSESVLSIRELACLLGVSKDIIFRA